MHTGTRIAAAVIAALSGTALGQAASWNNPAGGDWNIASNWTPGVVPNADTFDVTLGLGVAYDVQMGLNDNFIGTLSITNPLATLSVAAGDKLTIANGSLFNDGSIVINPVGSIFDSRLAFDMPTLISGSGEIVLGALSETGSFADARIEANAGATVTVGASQSIRGNGDLFGDGGFISNTTILADDPLGPGIRIRSVIDQTGGGQLDVGDGSITLGSGASIIGGQAVASGAGVLRVDASPAIVTDFAFNAPVEILGSNDRLEVVGNLTNNGTVTVNADLLIFNSMLRFMTDSTISGSGTFVLNALGDLGDAQIDVVSGSTATFGASQHIMGSGRIAGTAVINGSITATDAIEFGIEDTISGTGTLMANDGSLLSFRSATVSGLTIDTEPTGLVAATNGESLVSDVHNLGNLGIAGSSTRLMLLGDLTNDGLLTINYTDTVFNAVLDFESSASILGSGEIRMITSGQRGDAQIVTSNASVGTFGAGQIIAGSGIIDGDFVNLGVIVGDDPDDGMEITGTLDGPGQIQANGGTVLLRNAVIDDHTISSASGGIVTFFNGTSEASDIVNNGTLGIDGSSTRAIITGPLTNNGEILINYTDTVFNAILELGTADAVAGSGTIILESSGSPGDAQIDVTDGVSATLGTGQDVSGSGQFRGDLTVLGLIDPSGDLREFNARAGTLTLAGTARFDLGGLAATEFDRVTANESETIALGGVVEVNLDDGYTPSFGDEWEIIGGASNTIVTGAFDVYQLPAAPASLAYRVFIEPDRVFVRLTCAADFNGDAVQNFFDISKYIELFNSGDPRADLAAPIGALNFFDIAAYVSIYNAGCN